MKIVYNKYIPFKGYKAMMLFGKIYARKGSKPLSKKVILHETIHSEQAKDFCPGVIGFIMFYLTYLLEWVIKGICSLFTLCKIRAYKSISFEQEAYFGDKKKNYLETRKRFAWVSYIFKVVRK